jgi:hypothetical protein
VGWDGMGWDGNCILSGPARLLSIVCIAVN